MCGIGSILKRNIGKQNVPRKGAKIVLCVWAALR